MIGKKSDFMAMVIARLLLLLLTTASLLLLVSGSETVVKRDMSQAFNPVETDPPNYSFAEDGIIELTDKNFQSEVLKSNSTWVVIFDWPGPSCIWCQDFAEIFKNVGQGLSGTGTRLAFVNCRSASGSKLATRFDITMYPSIYIFGKDKSHPLNYRGPRSVDELMETILHQSSKPYPTAGPCGSETKEYPKSNVYELSDSNFEEAVLQCDDYMWMVNFYAATTKICVKFSAVYQKAATELKGRPVKFGAYDLSADELFQNKYDVTKVCTVKMFPAGSKEGVEPVDFNNGKHGVQYDTTLVQWVKDHISDSTTAEEVVELKSYKDLKTTCGGRPGRACIVLVLPEASKCTSACKKENLGVLNRLSEKYKTENWGWITVHAGSEAQFDTKFGLSKTPVVVGLDLTTKEYAASIGLLTESKFQEFLQFYSDGRMPLKPIPASALVM